MMPFWLINLVLFQISWLAAAFFTQYAAIIILGLICLNFRLSPSPKSDAKLILLLVIGISLDSLHFYMGTFSAKGAFFPLWLIMLWVMFSISFNHSLNWFTKQSYWLLALCGGIGGSLSYWGGIKTGALSSHLSVNVTLIILALSWSLVFPLLIMVYKMILSSDFRFLR